MTTIYVDYASYFNGSQEIHKCHVQLKKQLDYLFIGNEYRKWKGEV